jgi:hypothetical protein
LSRSKYHALTAATDLFQQFVIAELSQNFDEALTAGGMLFWC